MVVAQAQRPDKRIEEMVRKEAMGQGPSQLNVLGSFGVFSDGQYAVQEMNNVISIATRNIQRPEWTEVRDATRAAALLVMTKHGDMDKADQFLEAIRRARGPEQAEAALKAFDRIAGTAKLTPEDARSAMGLRMTQLINHPPQGSVALDEKAIDGVNRDVEQGGYAHALITLDFMAGGGLGYATGPGEKERTATIAFQGQDSQGNPVELTVRGKPDVRALLMARNAAVELEEARAGQRTLDPKVAELDKRILDSWKKLGLTGEGAYTIEIEGRGKMVELEGAELARAERVLLGTKTRVSEKAYAQVGLEPPRAVAQAVARKVEPARREEPIQSITFLVGGKRPYEIVIRAKDPQDLRRLAQARQLWEKTPSDERVALMRRMLGETDAFQVTTRGGHIRNAEEAAQLIFSKGTKVAAITRKKRT